MDKGRVGVAPTCCFSFVNAIVFPADDIGSRDDAPLDVVPLYVPFDAFAGGRDEGGNLGTEKPEVEFGDLHLRI
jgi:hypothetical protein